MNRELKFRAWQRHKGNSDNGWMTYYELKQELLPKVELVNCKENKEQTQPGRNFVNESKDSMDYAVMQFTGLKDKNGKEIYEGDIMQPSPGLPFQVVWLNGGFACDNGADLKPKLPDILDLYDGSEIIGNIYENPELIN